LICSQMSTMPAPTKTERGKMAKSILIIDDSAAIRQMVAFTLKTDGYNVVEAADGVEGIAMAKAHDIDLVLSDQNMPNMDGITFVKAMRGLPKYGTTPILMLTTVHGDEQKAQGREAGATGWLVKPFDPHILLEVVKKFLD
jgi:two-component system, chemotaxis family, chemotaxis protein CheY